MLPSPFEHPQERTQSPTIPNVIFGGRQLGPKRITTHLDDLVI